MTRYPSPTRALHQLARHGRTPGAIPPGEMAADTATQWAEYAQDSWADYLAAMSDE